MDTTTITDRYPAPGFVRPLAERFVYAGWSVDPPGRLPRVGRSARRTAVLDRLAALAREVEGHEGVVRVDVFEVTVMPPLAGLPRWDVLLLGRATTAEGVAHLRALVAGEVEGAGAAAVLDARNARRLGDTDAPGTGAYLFNHFTGPDPEVATAAWEQAAAWFLAETGVDNSLLLRPGDDAPFVLVNHAQLPCGPAAFLRRQLLRPSFHRLVRGMLREHGLAALPLFARRHRG